MEVMDGECKKRAEKELCNSSKMVGYLLEVSCWRWVNKGDESMVSAVWSIAAAARWLVNCWS